MRRIKKILIYLVAAAFVYVGLVEAHRTYARAQVEREMYANFQKNLCEEEEIEGDICKSSPERSFCISGEYIDYRTIWGRFTSKEDAQKLALSAFKEQGSLQRFGNWLSCQGFVEAVEYNSWKGPNYRWFSILYKSGYGPFQRGYPVLFLEWIAGWHSGWIVTIVKPDGGLERIIVGGNKTLN